MRNSLRFRLLLWLLAPLGLYILQAGWMARQSADRTAGLIQDNALLSSAQVMAGDIKWEDGYLHADISPSAIEILSSPYGDEVFFQIMEIGGPVIAGTSNFRQTAPSQSPTWFDTVVQGKPVRAVSLIRPMYDAGRSRRVLVTVAKTRAEQSAMAEEIWQPQLSYFAKILVIAIVLVCIGLTVELRPLMALTKDLRDRAPNRLNTLRADRLQTELRPIVEAINQSIERVHRQAAMQRRFVADAAHQLRTPLTLLGTQLQYARRSRDVDIVQSTLTAMHKSNRSLVALTNQLLLLAQAEAADYAAFDGETISLREVVTEALESLAALAQRRQVELSAHLDDNGRVEGNASLLSVLVFNVLDNAIRYAPSGTGRVDITLLRDPIDTANVTLTISDNGPGIPASIRDRVFEPFFRASDEEGSGLGLAIVREIARAHQAVVLLGEGEDGQGLSVSVRLRASEPAVEA